LLVDLYLADVPIQWEAIPERERRLTKKTERLFKAQLVAHGFLDAR
jgi:hypothetical protein